MVAAVEAASTLATVSTHLKHLLLVRDLRDDVPVVVHVDNPAVGRAVEEATGAGSDASSSSVRAWGSPVTSR